MLTDGIIRTGWKTLVCSLSRLNEIEPSSANPVTTWQLYRFAQGDQGAATVLSAIALEHGQVETAIVVLGKEDACCDL